MILSLIITRDKTSNGALSMKTEDFVTAKMLQRIESDSVALYSLVSIIIRN